MAMWNECRRELPKHTLQPSPQRPEGERNTSVKHMLGTLSKITVQAMMTEENISVDMCIIRQIRVKLC
jgi:hypothetical protein